MSPSQHNIYTTPHGVLTSCEIVLGGRETDAPYPTTTLIDRAAVLALLDRLIADPGHVQAVEALALVLRQQIVRLPEVIPYVE